MDKDLSPTPERPGQHAGGRAECQRGTAEGSEGSVPVQRAARESEKQLLLAFSGEENKGRKREKHFSPCFVCNCTGGENCES